MLPERRATAFASVVRSMSLPHSPSILAALTAALAAAPDDHALRLHLAQLLIDNGEPRSALEHAGRVIAAAPDHVAALGIAATAADQAGEPARAAAFRAMYGALRAMATAAAPAVTATEPAVSAATSATPQAAAGAGATPAAAAGERKPEDTPVIRLEVVRNRRDRHAEDDHDVERSTIRLDDVGGMAAVKQRLETAFLGPMRNPALVRAFGKSLRGGLLLFGPPGCGKTFLARAVAGELGASFLSVGLHDVLDMWLGESQRKLHAIFEQARRNTPCVVFFDEVDAIGRKRSETRSSGTRDVVVQLLAELDGIDAANANEGVFVLAATNHPWDVDAALRRPGRLDRSLLVLPPDHAARASILRYHLRDRPLAGDVDVDALAGRTRQFSGADLAHLCESAIELALADSISRGEVRPIAMADLERARSELTPSTTEWLHLARNYAQFANEAGQYDELLRYLRAEGMA